jgi:transcription elongation factor Elf1
MSEYWHLTRQHLEKATALLASGNEDKLIYACLELRKSLEAYSYDLLSRYIAEAPFRLIAKTWQADKVIKELVAIDPKAGSSSTLRIKRDAVGTEPPGAWTTLGEDRRLAVKDLRTYYQALGNFLHVPTIRQSIENDRLNDARRKATEIRERLEKLLAPGRVVSHLAELLTFNCTECEAPIARRISVLTEGGPVECGNCGQGFDAEVQSGGGYFFIPLSFSWDCPRCQSLHQIVRSKAKDGLDVTCAQCNLSTTLHSKQSWLILTRLTFNRRNFPERPVFVRPTSQISLISNRRNSPT